MTLSEIIFIAHVFHVFCKFEKIVTIIFAEGQFVMDWRSIEGNCESSLRREFFSVKEKYEELEKKR